MLFFKAMTDVRVASKAAAKTPIPLILFFKHFKNIFVYFQRRFPAQLNRDASFTLDLIFWYYTGMAAPTNPCIRVTLALVDGKQSTNVHSLFLSISPFYLND